MQNLSTPAETGPKLTKERVDDDGVNQELYQSAIGSLLYLSIGSRPDITYAVSNVAKFCAQPTNQHWIAEKRIMHYHKAIVKLGLLYGKDGFRKCIGYSDADWAGDIDDCKSTSEYLFQVSGAAVSWRSKSSHVWHCQLQKPSIWHYLVLQKKLFGCDNLPLI